MKKRIFDIIQIGSKEDLMSRICDIFIAAAIFINILSMFLQTFEEFRLIREFLIRVEYITVFLFMIEYALRIYTAKYLYPDRSEAKARLKFLCSYDGIVDLLTILPIFHLRGVVAFRMLRIVRIFRLFRINRNYDSFNVIVSVLHEKKNQIMSSGFMIFMLMLASSLGMYSAEHLAQPKVFVNAFSGLWWSVSTVLTIGYGDIYPITTWGKFMAICISFLGVGAVAIPTGIISAGFVEQYQKQQCNAFEKPLDIRAISEIRVDETLENITVAKLKESEQIFVYLVRRGELTLLAEEDLILRFNDIVIVRQIED